MRQIKATLFISADGVVEAPDQWHFPYFNDEMGVAVDRVMGPGKTDTLIIGRATYDSFAGAWPDRKEEGDGFAKHLGDCRKVVVSRQPLEFTWRNSELLEGDLVEGVAALKNEAGDKHIAISGSPSVVRQLLEADLLDELHLLVHPIAIRKGKKLFDEGGEPIPLKVLSSTTFENGVLDLVYGPAEALGETTYEDIKERLGKD